MGVLFSTRALYDAFELRLNQLKSSHFPFHAEKPLVLHRADILRKSGPFSVLLDPKREAAFNGDLLTLLHESRFTIVGVAVDKLIHGRKTYRRLGHSYHYCLHALLERYCRLLARTMLVGDACVEARGRKEDKALQAVYRGVYDNGTFYLPRDVARSALSSSVLKVVGKGENCAGLQLADLIAHPVTRDILRAYKRLPVIRGDFTNSMLDVIAGKYNVHPETGRIDGYGRVIL